MFKTLLITKIKAKILNCNKALKQKHVSQIWYKQIIRTSPLKNLFALNSNLSQFKDTTVQKNEKEKCKSNSKK